MSRLIVFLCGLAVTVLGYRVMCATKFGAIAWAGALAMTVIAAFWYVVWLVSMPLTMRKKDKRKKGDRERERRFWELHAALEHAIAKLPRADREEKMSLSGAFYLQEMFSNMDIEYDVDRDGRSEYDLIRKVAQVGIKRLYALNSEIGGDGWSRRAQYTADLEAAFDKMTCGQVTDAVRTSEMLKTFEKMDKKRTASMQETFSKMYGAQAVGLGALGAMYGGAQMAMGAAKFGQRHVEQALFKKLPTKHAFRVISGGHDVNNDGAITLEDFEADVRLHKEMGEPIEAVKSGDNYNVIIGDVKWVVPAEYFENLEAFWGPA